MKSKDIYQIHSEAKASVSLNNSVVDNALVKDELVAPQRRALLGLAITSLGSMSLLGACGGGGGDGGGGDSGGQGASAPTPNPTPSPSNPIPPNPTPAPTNPNPLPTGEMRFSLTSSVTQTLAPFTLGYVFREGDVPAGQQVKANIANVQVFAKNRWPDGSLKFAIISGRADVVANTACVVNLSVGNPASGVVLSLNDLKATGVTANINAGSFGTVSWTNTDWDQPFQTWVSGVQMSSWIYRKPIGSDAHLVAWLEVRLYSGGAVEVLPWVENGYLLVAGPTFKSETFSFTLGGTQRFSETIVLPNHCRTPLLKGTAVSHWLGVDPGVFPKHDTAYLQSTAVVPTYRAIVPADSARAKSMVASFKPLQQGNLPLGMGGAGYHGSIGLLPEWDVVYLTTTSQQAYTGVIFNAYSMGRYGIHFRDESTNRPLQFSKYPYLVVGNGSNISDNGASQGKDFKAEYTPNSNSPTSETTPQRWAHSHQPSVGFFAYIVTGRWYFMEEMQFAATINFLRMTDWRRGNTKGLFAIETCTTRGVAWAFRTLAQTACLTPDDDLPLRNEFLASLEANIDWQHARYVAQPSNPFGFTEPYSDYNGTGNNVYFEATWMQDFYTAAFGYAMAMKPNISNASKTRLSEFFTWKAKSIVGRLGDTGPNDYPFYEAAPYTIAVAPSDSPNYVNGTGPWFSTWRQIYDARTEVPNPPGTGNNLRGGYFPEATSYWGNLQPAIAYAVQFNVPGALAAYQRLTSAPNWNQIETRFNADPVWSVKPSNI